MSTIETATRTMKSAAALELTATNSAMLSKADVYFLSAAFASFVFSVAVWFLVNHDYGLFVGIWVPSILALWVGVRVVLLASQVNLEDDE